MRQRVAWAVGLVVVGILALGAFLVLRAPSPSPPEVMRPPELVSARPVTADGASNPPPPTAAKSAPAPAARSPLPPLLEDNPLTDDRFAAISAQIVIAAQGLKQDKNWEMLVLEYMDQTLQKEGVTPGQFKEYAEALYRNPDRGRAVAENIMMRVHKKLGTRVDMKTLPFMKFDEATIRKLEEKLKR